MSWNDFVIGISKNTGPKICSAIHIFEIPGDHGFSENSESYWISECIFDLGITIYKDTIEAKILAEMIKRKYSLKKIQNYIDSLIIRLIPLHRLKTAIKESSKRFFELGKEAKTREFKACLGLDECGIEELVHGKYTSIDKVTDC